MDVRLRSLRIGSAGRFFEGGHPGDVAALLGRNVVLAIEDVANDEDNTLLTLYEQVCSAQPRSSDDSVAGRRERVITDASCLACYVSQRLEVTKLDVDPDAVVHGQHHHAVRVWPRPLSVPGVKGLVTQGQLISGRATRGPQATSSAQQREVSMVRRPNLSFPRFPGRVGCGDHAAAVGGVGWVLS